MSFAPQGIPCRGPLYRPAAISASACFACSSARSSRYVTTQFSLSGPPHLWRRARYIFVSSVEVTCFVLINSARLRTDQNAASSRFAGRLTETLLMRIGCLVLLTSIPGTIGLKWNGGETSFGTCNECKVL